MLLPSFPASFDDDFPAGPGDQRAYVGRDVLRGLIAGIDRALETHRQERSARKLGPVLIGAAPWLTDPELIKNLKELSGACIVITKQGHSARDLEQLRALHELNGSTAGLPVEAFPDLVQLAPHVDDKPMLVSPRPGRRARHPNRANARLPPPGLRVGLRADRLEHRIRLA